MIKMKAIIITDSEILDKRLFTILTGISGLEIIASIKDVQEAFILIKEFNPDILVISPHYITSASFDTLKEIRLLNEKLLIIVLTQDNSLEYSKLWENAGANFIFDQAMQFNRMVDVLCSLLYRKQFNAIMAENANNQIENNNSSLLDRQVLE